MAKKTDSAAAETTADETTDTKATAKDLKVPASKSKRAIGNKAGATAQVGDANVDVDTIDRVANSPENGIPKQEREDLDVAYFRDRLVEEMKRLEEEREYLRRSASDMDGNLPEDAEGDDDTVDLASSLMDKEMDMGVEEEIEETLSSIEHAFQKIDDGTYGICDVSGLPIPKGRLELLPWAALTAQMQAMAEGD